MSLSTEELAVLAQYLDLSPQKEIYSSAEIVAFLSATPLGIQAMSEGEYLGQFVSLITLSESAKIFSYERGAEWMVDVFNQIEDNVGLTLLPTWGGDDAARRIFLKSVGYSFLGEILKMNLIGVHQTRLLVDLAVRSETAFEKMVLLCVGSSQISESSAFRLNTEKTGVMSGIPRWQAMGLSQSPTEAEVESV